MAGLGPPPKPAATRQRRNHAAGGATLTEQGPGPAAAPDGPPALPKRGRRKWHALTEAWWADVWASPMAAEYLQSDVHGLYVLAELVNQFWRDPSVALSVELRLRGQGYGLSPLDRRRLEWEVSRAEATRRVPGGATTRKPPAGDPRRFLQVVS
jgi:hypothetical protein